MVIYLTYGCKHSRVQRRLELEGEIPAAKRL
jgi:hypothetical protein